MLHWHIFDNLLYIHGNIARFTGFDWLLLGRVGVVCILVMELLGFLNILYIITFLIHCLSLYAVHVEVHLQPLCICIRLVYVAVYHHVVLLYLFVWLLPLLVIAFHISWFCHIFISWLCFLFYYFRYRLWGCLGSSFHLF